MQYDAKCPECGHLKILLVKRDSTPFVLKLDTMDDKPVMDIELPTQISKYVALNRGSLFDFVCEYCGETIYSCIDGNMQETTQILLDKGIITQRKLVVMK